ncbi:hypothetical protein [Klebsiella pneumoniae ISC21]|nr:hypothetical protein [Klebsiella pneumoniae ISC21]
MAKREFYRTVDQKQNVCQRLLIKIYTVNMRNEVINILYAKSHH